MKARTIPATEYKPPAPSMTFDEAMAACKAGAFVRDESGTMQAGWKIFYIAKHRAFYYLNPITSLNYQFTARDEHRASTKWRTTL